MVRPKTVRFGVFEADLDAGELRRNGIKVRIQDLPFRALTLLLSRPSQVVSRDDLRQTLWPGDVFVDFDQSISSAIRRLREALGDSAENPTFIETIDRRGYRWIAPVHLPASEEPKASEADERRPAEANHESAGQSLHEDSAAAGAVSTGAGSMGWKSVWAIYVLPLLLLLAAWSLRPSTRSAGAGIGMPRLGLSGPASIHPANQEAKDLYLQGRFYWNKRTPESLNQALDAFTQAIVHDPGYSDAYVGLADCYNLLREFSLMPGSEAYPRALAAAKKAVELDDRSSEGHASLAFVSFYGMWDAATADREFRRALELDPKNAKAHHWYAGFLSVMRRFDEALAEINRAQALDPDSRSILADKGRFLWMAGHRDESMHLLKKVEATDPDFVSPHRYLKLSYLDNGDYPAYLSEMKEEAVLLHDDVLLAVAQTAEKGFEAHGAAGMFSSELQVQKKLFEQGKLSACSLADTSARAGETQQTLDWLESCYTRHDQEAVNLAAEPAYNNLHRVAAFQQLLARIGLPAVN